MEFPFGHRHGHGHGHHDNQPPPPMYGEEGHPPPGYRPPDQQQYYPPPQEQQYYSPHSSVLHVGHEGGGGGGHGGERRARTFRVYCKAREDYSITIRDGEVVMAPSDPSDEFQHWIKDEKFSVRVKDQEGFPSFSLINKATGEAIQHSDDHKQVRLVPFNPDVFDESILWTESRDTGEGFRCIRRVNNILMNFDAFRGDKSHEGVLDGTKIVLWDWFNNENQRWKMAPYCKFSNRSLSSRVWITLNNAFK